MSNVHPVSQELIDGPVVFVPLARVKWLGDAFGPGSRASRQAQLHGPAPTGVDPYRGDK